MKTDAQRLLERIKSGKPIYGTKKNKKFGKLNAQERAKLYREKGLFNVTDVRNLPEPVLSDMRIILKQRDKEIGEKPLRYSEMSAPSLFERWAEQENIRTEKENEYKQTHDDWIATEKPPVYNEWKQVASDDEKWTILRRLAQIDGRLNIDRAFASETLHEIEDMIEKKEFNLAEITEQMAERLESINVMTTKWNEALQDFADDEDDLLLAQNKGFHGVAKARAKFESTTHGKVTNEQRNQKGHWIADDEWEAYQEFLRSKSN